MTAGHVPWRRFTTRLSEILALKSDSCSARLQMATLNSFVILLRFAKDAHGVYFALPSQMTFARRE